MQIKKQKKKIFLKKIKTFAVKNIADVYFFIGVIFTIAFITIKFGFIYILPIVAGICFLKTYLIILEKRRD